MAAASAPPTWCKAVDGRLDPVEPDSAIKERDPRSALFELVADACFPDGSARRAEPQLAQARHRWSEALGMTEADWADAAAWASHAQVERMGTDLPRPAQKMPWSRWSPIDQYAGIVGAETGDSSAIVDPAYLADALGDHLTQAGRLAYIESCLGADEDVRAVAWAMCQPDVEAFDAKAFAAELRGDKSHDGFARTTLRLDLFELAPKLARHARDVKALLAQDPAYAKLFGMAREARRNWDHVDHPLLELAARMDDARVSRSRKASAGCDAPTWAAFAGAVAAIPAKEYAAIVPDPDFKEVSFFEKAMAKVVGTPRGYLAAVSFFLCSAASQPSPDYLVRRLGSLLNRWPGYRGPRTATETSIMSAGIQLDDRDAKLGYPGADRPWLAGDLSSNGGGRGALGNVKVAGDKATLVFAKVHGKQTECAKGHYTHRITQIRSDGALVYEYICDKTKVVTFNEAPFRPQTVKARYAKGLKKGMFIANVEDVVLVSYPRAGAPRPATIAGVPVK